MKIKKFNAASMNEAFKKIKAEFGPDAVVLNVREIKRTNKLGMTQGKYLEVTAAVDEVLPKATKKSGSESPSFQKDFATYGRPKMQPRAPRGDSEVSELRRELAELRARLEHMPLGTATAQSQLFSPSGTKFGELLNAGVPEPLARQIVQATDPLGGANPPMNPEEKLLREVASFFPVPETPLRRATGPRIVALIGPTGVGKTTTIAKLAATDHVRNHKEVGLISMDTYRIAAVEQLRVFADLLKIPMEVAYKPEHMTIARRKFLHKDVIYIDTPGRSPRDEKSIEEIARYLKAIEPDEVHLVLNLSTRSGDLLTAARQFQAIPVNRILFSKLDETDQYGAMLDVVRFLPLPVSYVTFGQDVHETFREATRPYLSRLILGMETIA